MAVNLSKTLTGALVNIRAEQYSEFKIETRELFQQLLWDVVDLLNEKYSQLLASPFDLRNWINHQEQDEVAYFLNEASSNAFNYSGEKKPHQFQLWIGKKGFVLAVEQQGTGFNVHNVKDGGGFDFFRKCRNSIFFDALDNAKIVYLEYLF